MSQQNSSREPSMYARFAAMITTSMSARRAEIAEMDWLLKDSEKNGPATTDAEVESRQVPEFDTSAG